MAFLTAFRNRKVISAVAVVDAPLPGRPPENEPLERMAFYLADVKQGRYAGRTADAGAVLRKMKYAVVLRELDAAMPDLPDEELTALVRWIDTLDRL